MDTQLAVRYDWGVIRRHRQLDATYPDSSGSGMPATSLYAYERGRDNLLFVTNRPLAAIADGWAPIASVAPVNGAELFCPCSHTSFSLFPTPFSLGLLH